MSMGIWGKHGNLGHGLCPLSIPGDHGNLGHLQCTWTYLVNMGHGQCPFDIHVEQGTWTMSIGHTWQTRESLRLGTRTMSFGHTWQTWESLQLVTWTMSIGHTWQTSESLRRTYVHQDSLDRWWLNQEALRKAQPPLQYKWEENAHFGDDVHNSQVTCAHVLKHFTSTYSQANMNTHRRVQRKKNTLLYLPKKRHGRLKKTLDLFFSL